jgi:hypothetical protein
MRNTTKPHVLAGLWLLVVLAAPLRAQAQSNATPYPKMAPLQQYLMDRTAEIRLARTAAPPSISRAAEVMILGRHGYEVAVRGTNGFVCLVERSWTAGTDDPEFWNPKVRAPICFNPPAVASYLPLTIRKTDLVIAGRSNVQMAAAISAAIDRRELPSPAPGAMCYMMSKEGYLNDQGGHWHPHLMFFVSPMDPAAWGAGLPGSPILGVRVNSDHLTIFMVPVGKWSDGTADVSAGH